MNIKALEEKFNGAMFDIYRCAKEEANYTATIFLNMLSARGGLSTAKFLINSPKVSDGYAALHEKKRLDLTVEAMIVEQEIWHPLFLPEEIEKAKTRLAQYNYKLD